MRLEKRIRDGVEVPGHPCDRDRNRCVCDQRPQLVADVGRARVHAQQCHAADTHRGRQRSGRATWQWERTQLADGRSTVAAAPERYTLKFEGGGRVLLRADCNRGSGAYEVNGNAMKLGPAALSKMGCASGTQDTEFAAPLGRVTSYAISDGALVLTLADGATMRLRATPLTRCLSISPVPPATGCAREAA